MFNKFAPMRKGSRKEIKLKLKPWRQGHKRKSEAKAKDSPSENRPSRGQGLGPRTQAQVFSIKKVFKTFFQAICKRKKQKRTSQNFCEVSSIFHQNFNGSKNSAVLEPRTGQQGRRRGLHLCSALTELYKT